MTDTPNHMPVMWVATEGTPSGKCGTCGEPANWWHFADNTWDRDERRCDKHLHELNHVVAGLLFK